ncbi:hypothetical protein Mapa_003326 [Marchantia paleacea]|nr:hypothetical protein Mapa_003326 [Marchantia paleacea]
MHRPGEYHSLGLEFLLHGRVAVLPVYCNLLPQLGAPFYGGVNTVLTPLNPKIVISGKMNACRDPERFFKE